MPRVAMHRCEMPFALIHIHHSLATVLDTAHSATRTCTLSARAHRSSVRHDEIVAIRVARSASLLQATPFDTLASNSVAVLHSFLLRNGFQLFDVAHRIFCIACTWRTCRIKLTIAAQRHSARADAKIAHHITLPLGTGLWLPCQRLILVRRAIAIAYARWFA